MPRLIKSIDTLDNVGDSLKLTRYDGGLNTADSNEILLPNEAIIRKNWDTENTGAIVKVNGFTKRNIAALAAAPVLGLFRVYQIGITKKLLAISDGTLYYSDDDGVTFTQATSGTGLMTGVFNTGVNYNDLFFFTNSSNNLQHYTPGTNTMAASTDQPTDPCKVLLKRSDRRMIALVNAINGPTLYYSKINPTGAAADDWSATSDAGSIAIDGAKSEPLTGGLTFGSYDLIFKAYATFKVWGYPSPQVIRIPGSPGCGAPFSPSQGDGLGFHLAHDGVWMWDGNRFVSISDPIKPIIDGINSSKIQNAWGIYRNGFYKLFYSASGSSTNRSCVIYDVFNSDPYNKRNIWFERDGLSMNCPVLFNGEGDDNELYAGDSASTGFVYRLDFSSSGDDNGSNINAIYQTKYFNAGFPHLIKRYPKIHIRYYLSAGSLIINWFTNRGSTSGNFTLGPTQTGTKLGTFLLDTDSLVESVEATHTERLPDTAVGKDISIKITSNATGDSPIIRDIEIEWEGLYVE